MQSILEQSSCFSTTPWVFAFYHVRHAGTQPPYRALPVLCRWVGAHLPSAGSIPGAKRGWGGLLPTLPLQKVKVQLRVSQT